MFLVVSYWEPLPGKEAEFDKIGQQVSSKLREQPGVVMVETIKSEGKHVSVHGYSDESTYQKLIHDPNSEFNKWVEQYNVDQIGKWVRSERGETRPH